MARPEFNDFVKVQSTVASPGPNSDAMIVERFAAKTIQVHSYTAGTFKIQGTVGDHDDWDDIPGMTAITANGFFSTSLTLKKMRVACVADGTAPKVTFGGFDQRTDGA